MVREIGNVYQQDMHTRWRWFRDDYFDIFVWQKPCRQMVEIQLCCDKAVRERMLRWHDATGFAHHRIDSGEQSPAINRSPSWWPTARTSARNLTSPRQGGKVNICFYAPI